MYDRLRLVHPVYMAPKTQRVTSRLKRKPRYGVTFLRQWRQFHNLTLVSVAGEYGISHASLGRIERGLQPYNQGLLEFLAHRYRTDVASLINRNPLLDPEESIWSVWDQAKPGERKMIIDLAKTVLRTGT